MLVSSLELSFSLSYSLVCKKYGLYLYLDGARLSAALTSKYNDLTLEDLCSYTDMFYIDIVKYLY